MLCILRSGGFPSENCSRNFDVTTQLPRFLGRGVIWDADDNVVCSSCGRNITIGDMSLWTRPG